MVFDSRAAIVSGSTRLFATNGERALIRHWTLFSKGEDFVHPRPRSAPFGHLIPFRLWVKNFIFFTNKYIFFNWNDATTEWLATKAYLLSGKGFLIHYYLFCCFCWDAVAGQVIFISLCRLLSNLFWWNITFIAYYIYCFLRTDVSTIIFAT